MGSTFSTRSWSSAAWGPWRSSPGAVLCWCLSFGRVLVKKTQDNSKKLLLNAFGKQPRYVWLYRDGAEVQVTRRPAPEGRHHRRQHRRGRAGRRARGRGDGDDRPARAHGRVDAGREGRRRPGVRLNRDGCRQGLRVGRDVGQRHRLGQDQPDLERHGRLQAHVAAQGRATGRQGGDTDPGDRCRRDGRDGPRRSGRGPQQRLRHGHSHGRAAGDAQLAGACVPTRGSWSRTDGPSS